MKKIRMLRNHRELVIRHEYGVPDEVTKFRARCLVENGIAEEIEMAVSGTTERAVSPRGKKSARRNKRTDE